MKTIECKDGILKVSDKIYKWFQNFLCITNIRAPYKTVEEVKSDISKFRNFEVIIYVDDTLMTLEEVG